MPKYRYDGLEPVRHGSGLVEPGQVIELVGAPGKNWSLVDEPPRPWLPEPAGLGTDDEITAFNRKTRRSKVTPQEEE